MDRRNGDTKDREIRNNKRGFSSLSKERKTLLDLVPQELKDKKVLESNDEAFHLSLKKIEEIIDIIRSRKTPTDDTFIGWDEYAMSFFIKMLAFANLSLEDTPGNDDGKKQKLMSLNEQHLEDIPGNDNGKKLKEISLKEQVNNQYLEDDYEVVSTCLTRKLSLKEQRAKKTKRVCYRRSLRGPFEFGSYSTRLTPKYIPYHLYLLVKEAVDIMNNNNNTNTNDMPDLTIVEKKIRFFCNYFHSHLPPLWKYHRKNARYLVAKYDMTRKPRYRMEGYTPHVIRRDPLVYDMKSRLSPCAMVIVMSAIHSRKTPCFWRMSPRIIAFYCKLCSCFGIKEYHRLEDASQGDLCLMETGQKPYFDLYSQ